jgi:mannitol/fructose-specific phosphotransferase system IIA component (Ntr-type)
VVLIPRASDRIPGFFAIVRAIKLMANRLGAGVQGFVVGGAPDAYTRHFASTRPEAPVRVDRLARWNAVPRRLRAELGPDDLVVLLSARPGALSWHPALARIPAALAELAPESFLVIYPAETETGPGLARSPAAAALPAALTRARILVDLPRSHFTVAIARLLETAFGDDRSRVERITGLLAASEREFTTEISPGVVVPHLRLAEIARSMIFLGVSPEGVHFPHAEAPAHLVFLLLTPEQPAEEHLRQLAEIARLVGDPDRATALGQARSVEEAVSILGSGAPHPPPH